MHIAISNRRKTDGSRGFTLPEVLVSVMLLSLFAVANFYALAISRVQIATDRDYGIAVDFVVHYLETVKALEFENVDEGRPINELYDGENGAANITIHEDDEWQSVLTEDYLMFHPELSALENPEFRVVLSTDQIGGADHTKTVQAEVRWDPPLGAGDKLSVRLDAVRVKDR